MVSVHMDNHYALKRPFSEIVLLTSPFNDHFPKQFCPFRPFMPISPKPFGPSHQYHPFRILMIPDHYDTNNTSTCITLKPLNIFLSPVVCPGKNFSPNIIFASYTVSCQIGNMHSGKNTVVKLSW